MDPTARLLALIALLRGRTSPATFADVRAALAPMGAYPGGLAAARRMFERDKRALRDLGLPLLWDAGRQGYSLDPARRRPRAVPLSADQVEAIREAAGLAGGDTASPVAADARGAVERLLALARSDVYREPRAGFIAHHPEREPEVAEQIGRLVLACRRRLPVHFSYRHEAGGRRQPRRVEPWGLFARQGRWYLVGRCRQRDARRIFRVARMEDIAVQGLPDGPPRFALPSGFDLHAEANLSPWDWRAHEPIEAVLAVESEVAPLVLRALGGDARDAGEASSEQAPVGWRLVVRTVTYAAAIFDLALAWLPRVRPLGPGWVAEPWRLRMAAVARAHALPPADGPAGRGA